MLNLQRRAKFYLLTKNLPNMCHDATSLQIETILNWYPLPSQRSMMSWMGKIGWWCLISWARTRYATSTQCRWIRRCSRTWVSSWKTRIQGTTSLIGLMWVGLHVMPMNSCLWFSQNFRTNSALQVMHIVWMHIEWQCWCPCMHFMNFEPNVTLLI